jgi:ferritin
MISAKVNDAMNQQIKNELESSYLYLSMAAYFHSISLDGMAHWMRSQAHEETIHALKFLDHITDRGGKVELLDLKQLKTEWESPLEAWQEAYEHEQKISANINDLITLSREERDYASEPILAWFAEEQIEEEASTGKIADEVAMVGEAKAGLIILDRELNTRAFTAGSPFDPAAYSNEG